MNSSVIKYVFVYWTPAASSKPRLYVEEKLAPVIAHGYGVK